MPTNEELYAMEAIGVRIDIVPNGWRTTTVRLDKETDATYEETWPVRIKFRLARLDASHTAPNIWLGGFERMLCFFRFSGIVAGAQHVRDADFEAAEKCIA